MNNNKLLLIVTIICIVVIGIIAGYLILTHIISPRYRYVLKNEVIVANNTKEDEEKYNEYNYLDEYNKKIKNERETSELDIYETVGKLMKLNEFPLPRKIIYYHKGVPYVFKYGTDYYNEIIEINNKRDIGNLRANIYFMRPFATIFDLILNIDVLEYYYDEKNSSYFNLDVYWFMGTKKNKVYWTWGCTGNGVGLSNAAELREYLKTITQK